jgi:MYXO-CTERM domain-containing protein
LTGATAAGFNGPSAGANPASAGNTYTTGARTIRGVTGASSATFAGDSLSIDPGGRLLMKASGSTQVLTVNLILNGGFADQATASNDGVVSSLAGTILLNSASSLGALGGETLRVTSAISGDAPLSLGGAINANGDTGVVFISGNNNTYTSATSILKAAKVVLTNTANSATGTGPVSLAAGTSGALTGTGRSSGALTVTTASHIAPGMNSFSGSSYSNIGGAGTLTLGSEGGLTLTSAALDYDLSNTSSAAGGANDLLATGGLLTLGSAAFRFNELNGSLLTDVPYTLISGATGVLGTDATTFASSTTFSGGAAYTPTYAIDPNNNLTVTFAATPEPGALALLTLGGLTLLPRRRRTTR